MLKEQIEKLKNVLPESYNPFPLIDNRTFWESVSKNYKTSIIKEANKYLAMDIPVLNASVFMEFHRTGNRTNYQEIYNLRRYALNLSVLAELFENKGRYIDFMIDLIWMICEETTWIIPAHNNIGGYKHSRLPLPNVERPIIDLMAADTGASIATALYFFKNNFDEITPQISRRAEYELHRRIIRAYRDYTDYWWMGFMGDKNEQLNNWNPWINSNVLLILLLTEKNTHEIYYILQKLAQSLDEYINDYPEDGGCDEGPGYWGRAGASLFECLEILYEYSSGAINIFHMPKIKNMCRFIHRAHIADSYYVNFADAGPKAISNPALIFRFGQYIGDKNSMAFGIQQQMAIDHSTVVLGRFGLNRPIRKLAIENEMNKFETPYILEKSVFLEDIEVTFLRTDTVNGELFFAAKGGNNSENHNHNDVGTFIIYGNGTPFIIDTGNMVYTKKTFSPQRYEIWSNCSLWHNVPSVNGVKQINGKNYKATNVSFSETPNLSTLTMDIQNAYPLNSGINRWTRSVSMDRIQAKIEISDSFELDELSDSIYLRLMTHPKPEITGTSVTLTSGGRKLVIEFSDNLSPEYETVPLEDQFHKKNWGDNLYRLSFKVKDMVKSGNTHLKFKLY
ncbi:MAG: heparinase II/III family protein [Clostridiales bacterium]|nr:heparinase II/III family protein [Clostridiales bacterium]